MRKILIILSAIIALSSCSKKALEQTYIKQEANIDTYISRQFADMPITRRNGSNRITADTLNISLTDSLEYGDTLLFYYAGYVFTTQPSAIFATNVEEIAKNAKLDLDSADYSIKEIIYEPNSLLVGLENGLYGAKNGEHCIVIFSGKYGFGNNVVANIPKNSALAYEIWIQDIKKDSL